MTFDEAKALLLDMRAAKRRANAIKRRVVELESDYDSIQSALSGEGMPHGSAIVSRTEQLALRVASEREKHLQALEAYFAIEDKLAAAIESLNPTEQEIIICCYQEGKLHWQICEELNYSDKSIRRIKNKAIQKVANFLKDDRA